MSKFRKKTYHQPLNAEVEKVLYDDCSFNN